MSANGNDNVLDDNKLDFELLTRRQRDQRRRPSSSASVKSSTSSSTIASTGADNSTSSSVNDDDNNHLIWPLHLKPTFVNHYITGDIIGHGSYAEVRECVDMRTLERFAMKIIDRRYLARQAPRALANQLQEIRLLRRLQHENIILLRDCLFKGDYVHIILEYCPFTLEQLLNDQADGKFHVCFARRFFFELCQAVSYLHSLGIVHRDIKPQNMLLTNSGRFKLIDFGVSHMLSMWNQGDMCENYEGSPLFQAPEIVVGKHRYSGLKADVWSCGVTLFLWLYGQYPFIDEALLGLYDKILGEDLVIPTGAPTTMALTDLLGQVLEKDCLKRASIEQVLNHPWMKLRGATNECDDLAQSEFFDLAVKRHNDPQRWLQLNASSELKDMYRSMTVLPYLYKYHFPHLPIRRVRREQPAEVITINAISPDIQATKQDATTTTTLRQTSSPLSNTSSPHEFLDQDGEVEWGTKEQYQLLKIPQIRANRIRFSAADKRRKTKESKSI